MLTSLPQSLDKPTSPAKSGSAQSELPARIADSPGRVSRTDLALDALGHISPQTAINHDCKDTQITS